jgi:hypothetical protein
MDRSGDRFAYSPLTCGYAPPIGLEPITLRVPCRNGTAAFSRPAAGTTPGGRNCTRVERSTSSVRWGPAGSASPEVDWRRKRSLVAMTADRSLIARLAAHESWANTADPSARTAPARRALLDRFEREVDPDSLLSPAERARRAGHARKAYFARLALRSAQARRRTPDVEDKGGRSNRPDEDLSQQTGTP